MPDHHAKPNLAPFTPEIFSLAAFSMIERLLILFEAKGVISAHEHTSLYHDAAKDFSAPENFGTHPEINLAVANLLRIVAKSESKTE